MRRLYLLYKFLSTRQPSHITYYTDKKFSQTPPNSFLVELNTLETLFFHVSLKKCNSLDPRSCSSSNYNMFCNALLKFIRPYPCGIEKSRLRLGFGHLCEQKPRHGFKNIKSFCSCNIEAETTAHHFLGCYFYIQKPPLRMT